MRQLFVPTPYVVGDVRVYSFELNGELILFDTGPMTDEALKYLQGEIDFDRLKYVFITHWHPEHCGLAALLEKRTSAEIIISQYEAYRLQYPEQHLNQLGNLFAQLGFPAGEVERLVKNLRTLIGEIETPEKFRLIEESQGLFDTLGLEYFYCPWHSGSDVIYLAGNYAISGDTVLKAIYSSPSIEVDPHVSSGVRFSNYNALCAAISQLKEIEKYQFLPSHQDPITTVNEWIEFIVTKMMERTRTVSSLLKSGNSVYQTTVKYFGKGLIRNPLYFYIRASEVALSKDFLDSPELLVQALKKNGLLDRVDYLLKPEWIQ
jgi:hydroxyacylglutathione hydrolase